MSEEVSEIPEVVFSSEESSFYSRNEDMIILTLISTLTLLIFWTLDRVFYCFRKAPANATINPRRIIPVNEPVRTICTIFLNEGPNATTL